MQLRKTVLLLNLIALNVTAAQILKEEESKKCSDELGTSELKLPLADALPILANQSPSSLRCGPINQFTGLAQPSPSKSTSLSNNRRYRYKEEFQLPALSIIELEKANNLLWKSLADRSDDIEQVNRNAAAKETEYRKSMQHLHTLLRTLQKERDDMAQTNMALEQERADLYQHLNFQQHIIMQQQTLLIPHSPRSPRAFCNRYYHPNQMPVAYGQTEL